MSSVRLPAADVQSARDPWNPETEAEREAIREQVGRILASAAFRNSRRFPIFLRHTVEHALNGKTEALKERTLGVEAFGREADYDTAQDPVVRMTAGEVRKRLVQYYQAPEHENELRIALQPGSYIPEFFRSTTASPVSPSATGLTPPLDDATTATTAATSAIGPAPPPASAAQRWKPWQIAGFGLAIVTLAAAAWASTWFRTSTPDSALDLFWAPIVQSGTPALLCIGDQFSVNAPPSKPGAASSVTSDEGHELTARESTRRNAVRYTDAVTLAQLAAELGARDKSFRIRQPESTDFADLRDGPVVLVGGFNNAWTMRLSEGLRFTLAMSKDGNYIHDRQHPDSRAWTSGPRSASLAEMHETYGLITRVIDPRTGHPIVMTAGLVLGTRAAGECLRDAECVEAARRLAPGDWQRRNIQIVISTKVLGGDPGAPTVVTAHLW